MIEKANHSATATESLAHNDLEAVRKLKDVTSFRDAEGKSDSKPAGEQKE